MFRKTSTVLDDIFSRHWFGFRKIVVRNNAF